MFLKLRPKTSQVQETVIQVMHDTPTLENWRVNDISDFARNTSGNNGHHGDHI